MGAADFVARVFPIFLLGALFGELMDDSGAVIGAGTPDALPHNGAVVTLLAVCGGTHRESYFDVVMVGIVGAVIGLVAVIAPGSVVGNF